MSQTSQTPRLVLCICGGRSYRFTRGDILWLDNYVSTIHLGHIVHGDADGADTCADIWAKCRGFAVRPFPITPREWQMHGKRAGPLRNAAMVNYLLEHTPAEVLAFPGERGTRNMCRQAQTNGLRVTVIRHEGHRTYADEPSVIA